MTASPITISDIAIAVSIAAGLFGIAASLAKAGIAFVMAKIKGAKPEEITQSERCSFDHREIHSLVASQNANIARMLEQNGEQIKALSDANHNAELRHQIILARVEKCDDKLSVILRKMDG